MIEYWNTDVPDLVAELLEDFLEASEMLVVTEVRGLESRMSVDLVRRNLLLPISLIILRIVPANTTIQ